MALGLCHRARPCRLVGFDVTETDVGHLRSSAQAENVLIGSLPPELRVSSVKPEDYTCW